MSAVRQTLVFTWGNPSRGDDAIGPRVHDLLQERRLAGVDVLTDFQLQVEHVTDLEGRDRVLFVDASVSAASPFEFRPLLAAEEMSVSTHSVSPSSLLGVYRRVYHGEPPPAFLLSVAGSRFGLGMPLSPEASGNVASAVDFIIELSGMEDTRGWFERCTDPVDSATA